MLRKAGALYRELMAGKDGRLSFSKHVIFSAGCAALFGSPIPVAVYYLLVISSFGSKVLLAWLQTKPIEIKEDIAAEVKAITEMVKARRDAKDGTEETS